MYAKNCQIWLRRFEDKSKNVRWPRFLDHAVYCADDVPTVSELIVTV